MATSTLKSFRSFRFLVLMLLLSIGLIGGGILLINHLFIVTDADRAEYTALRLQTNPKLAPALPYTVNQSQKKVRKEIWFSQPSGERKLLRVYSDHTALMLEHREQQTAVVEKMSGATCYFQEELLYRESASMQVITVFQAEEATYSYHTNEIQADQARLARYEVPGHTLVESFNEDQLILQGNAHNIHLTWNEEGPHFTANEFEAVIETTRVAAGHVDYRDTNVILTNGTRLNHSLGQLVANRIEGVLKDAKTRTLKELNLFEEIIISPNQRGELLCSKAHIDCDNGTAWCLGDQNNPYVTYTENYKSIPCSIQSRQMNFRMSPQKNGVSKPEIDLIEALKDVTACYGDEFIISADRASYHPSIITLHQSSENHLCHIRRKNGDTIDATEAQIDVVKRQVVLIKPVGVLFLKESTKPTDFSCDQLLWNAHSDELLLKGHVVVCQENLGTLTTDHQLSIRQNKTANGRQISNLTSRGTTMISFIEPNENNTHTLTCKGIVELNPAEQSIKLVAEAPNQVFQRDDKGELYADSLLLNYRLLKNRPEVTKITLTGNVRMLNHRTIDPGKTKSYLEYVLADMVECMPQQKTLSLFSKDNRRVLLFDKINHLQISAPALHILRDEATSKPSIQGVGDVRFSFIKQEIDEMQRRFQFNE